MKVVLSYILVRYGCRCQVKGNSCNRGLYFNIFDYETPNSAKINVTQCNKNQEVMKSDKTANYTRNELNVLFRNVKEEISALCVKGWNE